MFCALDACRIAVLEGVLGEQLARPSQSPCHARSPPLLVGLGLLKWVGAGAGP